MNVPVQDAVRQPPSSDLWKPYAAELAATEAELTANLASEVPLVGEVGRYVLGSGGKRFRPLLVAASARLCGVAPAADGSDSPVALLGCVVEYIHTATLLHDDVVDDSDIRRGQEAARHVWGNAGSVLVGDYLYARALVLSVRLGHIDMVRVLTHAVEEMSQGEVFQLSVCGDTSLGYDDYIRVVELKTAALMSASCQLGGMLGQVDTAALNGLAAYGRSLGIAFQVADDALDYMADEAVFGKALGGDLKDGKVTLPLLYALERSDPQDGERLREILALDDDIPAADLTFVVQVMQRTGALDDALTQAHQFAEAAKKALTKAFPDSPERRTMLALADFVVARDR